MKKRNQRDEPFAGMGHLIAIALVMGVVIGVALNASKAAEILRVKTGYVEDWKAW